MKPKYFLLLLAFIAHAALAQKTTFSAKEFDKDILLQILGKNDQSLFYFKTTTENGEGEMQYGPDIEQFDFNLSYEKEIPRKLYHDLLKKKQNYLGSPIIFNNKIAFITQNGPLLGPWQLNIYQPFDNIESGIIDTLFATHMAFNMQHPYMLSNEDYLIVTSTGHKMTKQNEHDSYFYILDKNLKNISPLKELIVSSNPFVLKNSIEKGPYRNTIGLYKNFLLTSYPFGVYDIAQQKFNELDERPKIDNADYDSPFSLFDKTKNYLTYHALYKRRKTIYKNEIVSGNFSYTYDLSSGKIITSTTINFSEAIVNELSVIKTENGADLQVEAALHMNDESTLYIIESYSQATWGSYPLTNIVKSNMSLTSPGDYEKYFNIYLISIDKNGTYKWMKKIERDEKISFRKGRSDWGSCYAMKLSNDIVHIYLNDDDKVLDYTVDLSGNISKKVLFGEEADAAQQDVFIFPKYARRISESETIMPIMKNRKISLIKISY